MNVTTMLVRYSAFSNFDLIENNRGFQAKRRRTIWAPKSKVDEVYAEAMLSLLLWTWLSGVEPRIFVGSWSKSCGSKITIEYCSENKCTSGTWLCFRILANVLYCSLCYVFRYVSVMV